MSVASAPQNEIAEVLTVEECRDVRVCGGKAVGLARAATVARTPPGVCITADWYVRALGDVRLRALSDIFEDLEAGSGTGVLLAADRAQAELASLGVPPDLRAALLDIFAAVAGADGLVAVRSSAVSEDSANGSAAGVYRSLLDVPADGVCDAIVECWRSYYSLPAIAARSFDGDLTAAPAMAVLVQSMVHPTWAGVAFSREDGGVLVEATSGVAAALVDGYETGERRTLNDVGADHVPYGPALLATTRRLAEHFGRPIDVEWAWDSSDLVVLQTRAQTRSVDALFDENPVFRVADLYADQDLPAEFVLGRVASVHAAYVSKRGEFARLARSNGCAVGHAAVVNLSGRAMTEDPAARAWFRSLRRDVVVDASDSVRQMIVPATSVVGVLKDVLNLAGAPDVVHACIVREFVRGQGAITTRVGGGVLVEIADGDLLEMNRGLCGSVRAVVIADELPGELVTRCRPEVIAAMTRFTRVAAARDPGIHVEWALEDGEAYFVDFTSSADRPDDPGDFGDAAVLAAGHAEGPVYVLAADARLVDLSVGTAISVAEQRSADVSIVASILDDLARSPCKPIVYADRPYAILSVLREYVAGFVFDRGAVLCHLAILLRESGTAAVVLPADMRRPEPGDEIAITGRRVFVRRCA